MNLKKKCERSKWEERRSKLIIFTREKNYLREEHKQAGAGASRLKRRTQKKEQKYL